MVMKLFKNEQFSRISTCLLNQNCHSRVELVDEREIEKVQMKRVSVQHKDPEYHSSTIIIFSFLSSDKPFQQKGWFFEVSILQQHHQAAIYWEPYRLYLLSRKNKVEELLRLGESSLDKAKIMGLDKTRVFLYLLQLNA